MSRKLTLGKLMVYLFVGLFSLACLYPFLMVIGGSLTTQSEVTNYGIRVFPHKPTLAAYKALFINRSAIISGYKVTIFVTVVGTAMSLFVNSMMGYVLSRKKLRFRRFINLYVLITMLFSGGMVPWYMVCVHYLHLKNHIWALIIPSMCSAWYIFLLRNYFTGIPEEMYESAKIDGASEITIFLRIYLQLSKPVLATVTLFTALGYWNDWWLGLMLIEKSEMQPLQMLLRNIISNIQFLQTMQSSPQIQQLMATIPGDGIKMALVIITTGPIILLYPLLQRYFIKGIMVGAVKG
ncbi:MAG: binding-protein-dependent transport system inner rane component [Herbinix sp.]|jgi:putative aldouronate transport system permease protein|nr:binding-protein-dependent transport system inner rane component [Herbinix sp.]